jgi:signal transduction histidine kinase
VLLAMCADRVDASRAPAAADVTELQTGLQEAIAELRALVDGVMPAGLSERGLYAAVMELADRVPIPLELKLDGCDACLPGPVQSTGYFVIFEAVTNALKHARANELSVCLAVANGRLRIDVCDDGVGGAVIDRGGGIRRLGDRVGALGGRLRVGSPAGGGTRVIAEVPCES